MAQVYLWHQRRRVEPQVGKTLIRGFGIELYDPIHHAIDPLVGPQVDRFFELKRCKILHRMEEVCS